MGLVGLALKIVGALVLVLVALGAYLYFTDYAVEGTVTSKGRDSGGDYVVVTPKLFPRDIRQDIDSQSAQFVCEGYGVSYRVQSGHYQVRDREGRLIYDSTEGLTDTFSPIRCALLG